MAWDNKVSQKDAVKAFLVETTEGKYDLKASAAKYEAAALRFIASQEAENGLIEGCMSELFDFYKGACLNLDYIKSQTVERMKKAKPELSEPTLFNMLTSRVEEYLHENCNQEAVAATEKRAAKEAVTGKAYAKKMGKNGGFYRVCDQG